MTAMQFLASCVEIIFWCGVVAMVGATLYETMSLIGTFVNYLRYCARQAVRYDDGIEQEIQRCKIMGIDSKPMLVSGYGLFDAVDRTPSLVDLDGVPVDPRTAARVRAVWAYDRAMGGVDKSHYIAVQEERYSGRVHHR